ncbi:hypothetical protein ABZP36_028719 [Zizania latifolia]
MAATSTAATASTSTTTMVEGWHRFRVVGYSATKGAGPGHRVASGTFNVGGFDWVIVFYPDGLSIASMDYVSVYVEIKLGLGGHTARAFYDVRLVHPLTGDRSSSVYQSASSGDPPRVFCDGFASWGYPRFMRQRELEGLGFVHDDCLTMECVINVIQDPVVTAGVAPKIEAPLSNVLDHLAGLLYDKDTADVTFVVQDEEFAAHKTVMAMRSPVFKAELYGPMKDTNPRITIDGMEQELFRALLHFIYTNAMLAMDDDDDRLHLLCHLLEAADRYAVEKLKLIYEGLFCKNLNVDIVVSTLVLANQHNCQRLKEACVEFLLSSKMEGVLESHVYMEIKRSCPSFLVDLWETIGKIARR